MFLAVCIKLLEFLHLGTWLNIAFIAHIRACKNATTYNLWLFNINALTNPQEQQLPYLKITPIKTS